MHDCGWSAACLNFSTQQYHYNYTYVLSLHAQKLLIRCLKHTNYYTTSYTAVTRPTLHDYCCACYGSLSTHVPGTL